MIGGDCGEGPDTVRENGRLHHLPVFSDEAIGFRLVHNDGPRRVRRGGSWSLSAQNARVADRFVIDPAGRYDRLGFRMVRDG
jgi:formylglycine-generating enzyme required for sulfatase activity